jgi:hypothetical protein
MSQQDKETHRLYMRQWRARRRGLEPVPDPKLLTVNSFCPPVTEPIADGPVVRAVRSEIASSAAAIIDDKRLGTTAPSAMRQLAQALQRIRDASAPKGVKLAQITAMSRRL